jgi:sugar lactone lactonase YvrE
MIPSVEPELARQIGDALSRFHDPVALRAHPLSARHGGIAALRTELTSAIEALRPGPNVDPSNKAWRPYHLLTLRYLEGLDRAEVERRLAISKSQYYREHESAIAAVASHLRERGWSREATAISAPTPRAAPRRHASLGTAGFVVATMIATVVVAAIAWWNIGLGTPSTPAATSVAAPTATAPAPPKATLTVYAGDGQSGYVNGPAATARFNGPFGLAVGVGGALYVADTGNHRIRRISTTGLVSDLAGSGISGFADGPSDVAQFSSPNAVTAGPDGTVYVGDTNNLRIRAIAPDGNVTTLAGSGQVGYVDAVGTAARFTVTAAIISGPDGSLYVPDAANNVVRKITPAGAVSTFAGNGRRGHVDGPHGVAQLNAPTRGGGVDAAGNVYVLDTGDNRIRKIAPDGSVSTVAGTGVAGYQDGPSSEAQFSNEILGVITDAAGNLFVMDAGNRRVRKVTVDGMVSTLFEFTDPNMTPGNIKVDAAGNLFISDRPHHRIYKLTITR